MDGINRLVVFIFFNVIGKSHYAFVAEIKGDENSQDMTILDFVVDGLEKDNEHRPKVLKSLTNPNTIFGLAFSQITFRDNEANKNNCNC